LAASCNFNDNPKTIAASVAQFAGMGEDIPPMICHPVAVLIQVWWMREVEGSPWPELSTQREVIQ
jgi:hypothetical protein